jgi:hypothetical protein
MTTATAGTNLEGGVPVRFAHLHAALQVHHHRAPHVPHLLSLKCSALPVACPVKDNAPYLAATEHTRAFENSHGFVPFIDIGGGEFQVDDDRVTLRHRLRLAKS